MMVEEMADLSVDSMVWRLVVGMVAERVVSMVARKEPRWAVETVGKSASQKVA
jgi:hypothetical protein